jgi:hypothetical protein
MPDGLSTSNEVPDEAVEKNLRVEGKQQSFNFVLNGKTILLELSTALHPGGEDIQAIARALRQASDNVILDLTKTLARGSMSLGPVGVGAPPPRSPHEGSREIDLYGDLFETAAEGLTPPAKWNLKPRKAPVAKKAAPVKKVPAKKVHTKKAAPVKRG